MYIVTGGAGFIGSALVSGLNAQGIEDILIVDELGDSLKWKNLLGLKYEDYLHKDLFIQYIRSGHLPDVNLENISGIVHMGACSATTEEDMDFLMENNVKYTRDLARFAVDNRIRFIYASSAATYGDGSQGYSDSLESVPGLVPLNRYGYSKQLFDLWAMNNNMFGKIAGLKFFNVYGPNEYHKGSMKSVPFGAYHQIKDTGKVKLFKSYRPDYQDGEQKRDFIYVKDCVETMIWLLNTPEVNGLFNLGTGNARSWNDLARAVFSAMNVEPSIEYIDMPDNLIKQYQYFTQAEMSSLAAAGCPVKFHSLEDGIRDYVQNYLSAENPYC
jgi:ADP-L-glycero-D-manno-heptose 6-epimerase